jgi:hypothetical protein
LGQFVVYLDHDIQTNKNMDFSSLIRKNKQIYYLKVDINDNIKITSDNNNKISLNDFKINGQIELVIKLSYIWNKNNIKFGLSSHIYQIKYYNLLRKIGRCSNKEV